MTSLQLRGAKSGAASAPTQAPDTLSSVTYAQILDLVSEGPIQGPPSGAPAQSVYLNDVPLQNPDGTYNFEIDGFDFRYGDVDQTYISGFAAAQNEVSVGVELKQVTPWNLVISDLTYNRVIITLAVSALSSTNSSTGDVNGYTVDYQIQLSVDGGAFQTVVNTSFNGKCTSAYQRSHAINLAGATSQYAIRVVRTTADTTSVYIQDTTSVAAYTLVVDAKLTYPYSALAAISVNAVQFSSIPTRSYDLQGLIVSVPSNYDPIARTYGGTWDGTFKQAWTNNPAWIFYDLVTQNRYALGQWVGASQIDRYALYAIAKYCDVMVSDGAGGQEPRFTCNCYIQTRADAYKVLQDIASVFRGMAYWGAGAVTATADMPSDPVYVYTAANVVGGTFKYVGSARKTRYTAVAVTWNDPNNGYKQAVEYVQDQDGITRYGLNETQLTAFGTTSRGQAQRIGQWLLLTSRYETNAVSFSVGLDGSLCMPGQIIAVADANKGGYRMAGRLHAVADIANVTLDKGMPQAVAGDILTVIMPSGAAAKSTIVSIDSTQTQVTVDPVFGTAPVAGAVWMIESGTVGAQLFRVTSVAEKDGISFDITATEYQPAKYAAIDDGAAFTPRSTVGNSFTTQVSPTDVACSQYVVTDQGIAKTNLSISWTAAPNAVSYSVQWQKGNGAWVTAGTTGQTSIDVPGIYSGNYVARVCATNGMGITSVYAYSSLTALQGKTGAPPVVATLTASTGTPFAINLGWSFPASGAADTAYTEVWYSLTNSFANAQQLGCYAYPTNSAQLLGLAAGSSLFFWARLVDTTGNVGAWYPDSSGAGVNGQASSDASALLTYLTGQITASQLGADVLGAIANVIPPDMSGSAADYAGADTSYVGTWSETSARQEADLQLLDQINGLVAANGPLMAAIQSEATVRADADSAQATQIQAVQASVDQNSADVQTVSQSFATLSGQLSASYTIKTQVTANGQTYVAGIGLGVTSDGETVSSQVLVSASQFAVIDPNGVAANVSPFIVQGGQVYMNQALIGTGWITNAMIGQTIQSTEVGANGQPLWIIDKANGITFNGANGGSGYLNMNSSTVTVYDQNGTLRVRMGIW